MRHFAKKTAHHADPNSNKNKELQSYSAFTFLELLVTLAILGILFTIALPSFAKMVEKSRVRDAQTTLNMIFQAERIYRLEQGSYGTLAQLVPPNNYLASNPTTSTEWAYAPITATDGDLRSTNVANDAPNVTYEEFTARATRTGGTNNAATVTLDNTFTGSPFYDHDNDAATPPTIYGGNHPRHD